MSERNKVKGNMVLGKDLDPAPVIIAVPANEAHLGRRFSMQQPFFVSRMKSIDIADRLDAGAVLQSLQRPNAIEIEPRPIDHLLPQPARVQIRRRGGMSENHLIEMDRCIGQLLIFSG